MATFPSTPVGPKTDFMTLAQRDAIIARVNPPENFINADDKIVTAQLAAQAGVPHVPILAVVDAPDRIAGAVEYLRTLTSFVIKPARGTGGSGIVVASTTDGGFVSANGAKLTPHALRTHLKNILDGLYSMGVQPDRALIQPRIQPHPFFPALHGPGVADIRVIVYMGKPVMAMLRLPTRESGGKANLHAGAIGVGIDMATGVTTHGVYRGGEMFVHPDTQVILAGHLVPQWREILNIAGKCTMLSGLGFLGADVVLDTNRKMSLLEINARPGLDVQIANKQTLYD